MSNLNSYFGENYLEFLSANRGANGTHAWPQRAYCPNGKFAFNFDNLHDVFKVPAELEVSVEDSGIKELRCRLQDTTVSGLILLRSLDEIFVSPTSQTVNELRICASEPETSRGLQLTLLHNSSEEVSVNGLTENDKIMISGLVLESAKRGVAKRLRNGTLR